MNTRLRHSVIKETTKKCVLTPHLKTKNSTLTQIWQWKHILYATTSEHALTVWNPTWWVPSPVWAPADWYGSQYRSIGQDIHSNETCWHIPEPPSFHSLHTCNSASPSKPCGCKTQNFRSILVQNSCVVCVKAAYMPSVSQCTPIFQMHCFHDIWFVECDTVSLGE